MSITIEFIPWRPFHARKNDAAIQGWLQRIADASKAAFSGGMGSGGPSAPGAWPNSQTGGLKGSIQTEVTSNSMTIGTSMPYSGFLRSGTSKMARRKMSDNALQEGMAAGGRLTKWVEWVHG